MGNSAESAMHARVLFLIAIVLSLPVVAPSSAKDAERARPAAPTFPFSDDAARQYQQAYAQWMNLPVEYTHSTGMTFVLIPPGTFLMGSPEEEPGRNPDEGPRHTVMLTQPFYLAKHEVTFGQFEQFVAATGYLTDGEKNGGGHAHDATAEWKHRPGTSWRKPGYAGPFKQDARHPVVHVSHADAEAFCHWLSKLPRGPHAGGGVVGLPTEAQWEWACRAGSADRYWWGADEDTTGKVANAGDRRLKEIHPEWPRKTMPMDDGYAFLAPVGSYRANGFGLHDMLGNVWEFCSSRAGPYPREAATDPNGGDPKRGFAVRGGGWSNEPQDVRCATRNADPPHFCHSNLGFRVAITIPSEPPTATAAEILEGLRDFYRRTARADGSFQPGIDPEYRGMSDAAYSDLASVTYAVTIHKTFGWTLPHEKETGDFLLSRQKPNGDFFNVAGTVSPTSPEGRTYNTTQALVALHALGLQSRFNPLPVFEAILQEDYKQLPAYSTSFFPLAYRCAGQPIPEKADRGIKALMVQDETGYSNNHVAATFHASHYYRLVGEETPRANEMVSRILREQKPDGSWLLHMPGRDRHATFDAVFTLVHEGDDSPACRAAIRRAADWALACRNPDGGFGHYPGSTSDADANYFQVGTLVMAGVLKPCDPLPKNPELLSWGHLMPVIKKRPHAPTWSFTAGGWVGGIAFDPTGKRLAVGSADQLVRIVDSDSGREFMQLPGHNNAVSSVQFSPSGDFLATGSYDHTAAIWNIADKRCVHRLKGHRGAVLAVAFSPSGAVLATAGIDGTIKLWDTASGELKQTLRGHKSWVSGVVFHPQDDTLISSSSDGTLWIWSLAAGRDIRKITATNAEVRSLAVSRDGSLIAAGLRYGPAKVWNYADGTERSSYPGQGDMCAVAFSEDGKTIEVSEGDWNRGGVLKLLQLDTGVALAKYQHTGEILCVAFSPDGKSLAAGAADKTTKLWRLMPEAK